MSGYLPCGTYFESYKSEQKWWRTPFIKGKMIFMLLFLFVLFPLAIQRELISTEWLTVAYTISYYVLAGLGVQLLIGYCGQITLGHSALLAVGAYTSALMILHFPWPEFLKTAGLAYPISVLFAAIVAGLTSVVFGLPSARVKGFYLIMTTMAQQFVIVDFVITQYVSQIGGRAQAFPVPPGTVQIGPWVIDNDMKVYYLSVILVCLCLLAMGNLLRSKLGRAWVAIRDNDIAAETMGVNIFQYKLLAFFVAGFFGGIAGAFWITATYYVSPESFTWGFSLLLVGIILIGGVGNIQGLVFGSAFVVLVFKLLEIGSFTLGATLSDSWPQMESFLLTKYTFLKDSAFGLAIILFLIYEPNGLAYRYWQLKNYFNLWPFSYTGKGA